MENHALTPGGKLKKPSITVLGEWILIMVPGRGFPTSHLLLDSESAASPIP
jgi:hypothetical protein